MKIFLHRLELLARSSGLSLLLFCAAHGREMPTPLAVYGRLPAIEDVALSPDGSKLAWLKSNEDARIVVIERPGGARPLALLDLKDRKVRSVRWLDESTLLLTFSTTELPPWGFWGDRREWYFLETYDLDTHQLTPVEFKVDSLETFNAVSDSPMVRRVEGMTTLFVRGVYVARHTDTIGLHRIQNHKQALPALFRYTVATRHTHAVALGSTASSRWIVDEEGQIAAQFSYDGAEHRWDLDARRDGRLVRVASAHALLDPPGLIGMSEDGRSIYVRFIDGDSVVWKPLSVQDGTWGPPLADGAAFDSVFKDRLSGRVIGGSYGADDDRYAFFDPHTQAHWNTVRQAFDGEHLRLVAHSDDFKRLVVQVFGAQHGFVYELIEWDPVHAEVIGEVYEGLAGVAEVSTIQYPAADGLQIPAQLTLPRDRPAGALPLIVMPHDGPAQADTPRFNWWAQALAAEGYAVLQPNFRGSNLGRRFLEAGFGEWGRKMQSDLSDGVRYLAAQGVIDPARVCIAGRGYGGYAALAGVTLQSGIYRCAISVAGISDLKRFLSWANLKAGGGNTLTERNYNRFLGISGRSDASLHALSPDEHVAAATVPVLLIHGRDDTVVPYEQSDVMAAALKRAGRAAEFVTLDAEDHWLSRGATRQRMLEATVAFLRANNPTQ